MIFEFSETERVNSYTVYVAMAESTANLVQLNEVLELEPTNIVSTIASS